MLSSDAYSWRLSTPTRRYYPASLWLLGIRRRRRAERGVEPRQLRLPPCRAARLAARDSLALGLHHVLRVAGRAEARLVHAPARGERTGGEQRATRDRGGARVLRAR